MPRAPARQLRALLDAVSPIIKGSLLGRPRQTRKKDSEAAVGRNPADVGKSGSSNLEAVVKADEQAGSVRRRRVPCVVRSEIGWTANRDGDVFRGLGEDPGLAIFGRLDHDVRCA